MIYQDLETLIYSLSAAEKKKFQSYTNQLGGEKKYFRLYQIILLNKNKPSDTWKSSFNSEFPNVALESLANYLYKVLTDVLINTRIDQNSWYQQFHGLMKAQLCFERSIPERGLKEINAIYKKASLSENYLGIYMAQRMELNALQAQSFVGLKEQDLIDRQMNAKLALQSIRDIQEHYSLYELLVMRINNKLAFDKDANDLILGELNLTFHNYNTRFETKKVHLLFQSHFFIHKSDYQSALQIFQELAVLFESNTQIWNFPPYDYLSTLDGILNSLRSTSQFEEMQTYIDKVKQLQTDRYPDHFRKLAVGTGAIYSLNRAVCQDRLDNALELINDESVNQVILYGLGDLEKKIEWYFFRAACYYIRKDFQRGKALLNEMFFNCSTGSNYPAFRAGRLLYIVIIYELDDAEYISSEIRAYKRLFQKKGKLHGVERLIFKLIGYDPKRRGNEWKRKTQDKVNKQIETLLANKREITLYKYIGHLGWFNQLICSSPRG